MNLKTDAERRAALVPLDVPRPSAPAEPAPAPLCADRFPVLVCDHPPVEDAA